MPFNNKRMAGKVALPFDFPDYLQLLNNTLKSDKSRMEQKFPQFPSRLLTKLGMTKENWRLVTSNFETLFTGPVGCPKLMDDFAKCCDRGCRPNVSNAQKYLS